MSEDIYKEFSSVEAQIKAVNEKIELFTKQKKQMKDALYLIDELKVGQTIKVPIVDGVFIDAAVLNDTFYLQTSTDIVAGKKKDDVKTLIKGQFEKTVQTEDALYAKLHELSQKLDLLQKRLNDVQVSQR